MLELIFVFVLICLFLYYKSSGSIEVQPREDHILERIVVQEPKTILPDTQALAPAPAPISESETNTAIEAPVARKLMFAPTIDVRTYNLDDGNIVSDYKRKL